MKMSKRVVELFLAMIMVFGSGVVSYAQANPGSSTEGYAIDIIGGIDYFTGGDINMYCGGGFPSFYKHYTIELGSYAKLIPVVYRHENNNWVEVDNSEIASIDFERNLDFDGPYYYPVDPMGSVWEWCEYIPFDYHGGIKVIITLVDQTVIEEYFTYEWYTIPPR